MTDNVPESFALSELIPRIGFVRDLIVLGQTGANVGFGAASACTQFGFKVATNAIGFSADAVDTLVGGNEVSNILRSVHTTVGAAEAIALTSILLAHSATAISLHAADTTLELSGVQRTQGFVVQSLRAALPTQFAEYTPVIQQIAEIVLTFVAPIKELSHMELRETLVAYALLQQSNRLPLQVLPPQRHLLPHDFIRCMGFAAAAYGHLAMNFLEFIPRGIYQSDVLPLLVPGVTSQDIIRQNEDVTLYGTGYVLVIDHLRHTLVLAVRGSFHVNDIITDLTCQHANCSHLFRGLLGNGGAVQGRQLEEEVFCHEGFLLAANALDSLLQDEVGQTLKQCGPSYSLLITGHSLGAGVASVLTMKWRNIFPKIRCVALAPPCVFTLNGARACKHNITSVVIGDDMVSRLSLSSSYDLRDACVCLHKTSHHNAVTPEEDDEDEEKKGSEEWNIPPLEHVISIGLGGQKELGDVEAVDIECGNTSEYNPTNMPYQALSQQQVQDGVRNGSCVRDRPCNLTRHILDTNASCSRGEVCYKYSTLERSAADTELFEYSQYTTLEPVLLELENSVCDSHGGDSSGREPHGSQSLPEPLRNLKPIMEKLRTEKMVHCKLFPPGRLVHIVDSDMWESSISAGTIDNVPLRGTHWTDDTDINGRKCNESGDENGEEATTILSDGSAVDIICRSSESVAYVADQLTFAEMQLSADMFSSHMPTQCLYKLRELFPLST